MSGPGIDSRSGPARSGLGRLALRFVRHLWRATVRRDDASRYVLADRAGALLRPLLPWTELRQTWLRDRDFRAAYARLEGDRLRSLDRKYALDQLAKIARTVPGDTAECGAWRGASSWFICRRIAGTGKRHHVFDSFEGLPEPEARDGRYWKRGDMASGERVLRETLAEFDFVDVYAGWIPERFPEIADRWFSFVHVDVDLYQPTRDSIEFFYPRIRPGGILLFDDYGFSTCPGAREAVDSFFADKPEPVVHLPTSQGLVIRARG